MGAVVAIMLVVWLIRKTVEEARTDQALAEKGIVSPRLQAKYGDAAREKTARYGLVDYLRDAWSDNWEQRTEARRSAVGAAKTAGPAAGRSRVRWRDRVAAARTALSALAERAAPVVRKLVDPVPDRRGQPAPGPTPVADAPVVGPAVTESRTCPDCGEPLTATATGWDHRGGKPCAVTGRPYRRPAPRPAATAPPAPRRACPDWDPELGTCGRPLPPGAELCYLHDGPDDETVADVPCGRCGQVFTAHIRVDRPGLEPAMACPQTENQSSKGDPEMSAPTGEAVNYETTVAELEAIAAEQRAQIDAAAACLRSVEEAKSAIDGMQNAARTAAEASASVNDHLAALNLDSETLGHVGTAADALPASTVDRLLTQLEEVEATAREYLAGAETALAATEAALAAVVAKYGDAAATVAGDLGGDARFLDSGAGTTATPVGAGV